jgi:hypothetical protein
MSRTFSELSQHEKWILRTLNDMAYDKSKADITYNDDDITIVYDGQLTFVYTTDHKFYINGIRLY